MDIAIIEFKNDIYEALKFFPPHECLYLSVSAEASCHLSDMDISFVTEEDVLQPAAFMKIGNENFKIAEKWIQSLEDVLQSKYAIFALKQVYPFRWHFYRIKILLDAVRIRRELLEKLLRREKPEIIGLPNGATAGNILDYNLFFHKYDSLYGLLGHRIAVEKGIKEITWNETEYRRKKLSPYETVRKYLDIVGLLRKLAAICKRLLNTTDYLIPKDSRPSVIVLI